MTLSFSDDGAGRWLSMGLGTVFLIQVFVPVSAFVANGPAYLIPLAILPFLVLVAAIGTRNSAALLVGFPVSILPTLATIPPAFSVELRDPEALLRLVGTMAVYLAIASAWAASADRGQIQISERLEGERRGQWMRRFVYSRVPIMVLLFVVPSYAIFIDGAIVATIAQSHPGNEMIGQVFIATLLFFVWCAVAYSLFIVPSLNLEYDRRRLKKVVAAMLLPYDPKRWWRVAVECGGVLLVCLGAMLI